MNEELRQSAIFFEQLIKKEYNLSLGYKGKSLIMNISFDESNFYHLSGLHKLKDLDIDNKNKYAVFRNIINSHSNVPDITTSQFYKEIENRIKDLINLEYYLDNSKEIFGWNLTQARRNKSFSMIKADYLIKNQSICIPNENAFIFFSIRNSDISNKILYTTPVEIIDTVPSSFFGSEKDYSNLQKRFTLLCKEKIDKKTNETKILYQLPSYKPINGENPLPVPQIADLNDEAAATKEEKDSNFSTPQIVTLDDDFTTTDQTNVPQSGKLKLSDVLNRCNEVMNKQEANTSNKGKDISVQKNKPVK